MGEHSISVGNHDAKGSGFQLIEFTYAHVKWFYGQSDYYWNYFIKYDFNDRKSNIYKKNPTNLLNNLSYPYQGETLKGNRIIILK